MPPGAVLPDLFSVYAGRLGEQLWRCTLSELAPGRLVSWLPVAFGFGIVLYFTAEREPYWWASVTLASAGLAIAIIARRSAFGFPLALALAAVAVTPSVEAF